MSRERKFTEGPWTVVDRGGYICVRNDSNLIDTTITDDILTTTDDANLIAAAPELLEALEYECGQCKDDDSNFRTNCRGCKTGKAIKKAYGETP